MSYYMTLINMLRDAYRILIFGFVELLAQYKTYS